jgi:hypothetical protein
VKGCSYVVEEVMPKERDFVTAAIAAIERNGSEMGNWAAPGSTISMFSGPL